MYPKTWPLFGPANFWYVKVFRQTIQMPIEFFDALFVRHRSLLLYSLILLK